MRGGHTWRVYYDFIDHFLSLVVGKRYYNQVKHVQKVSDYASTSDEALALLIVENNYARWVDMAKNNNTRTSRIMPKFTNGGVSDGDVASSRQYQGWSDEGLSRFNELFQAVSEDRATECGKQFEVDYMRHCLEGYLANQKKKKRKPMDFDAEGNEIQPMPSIKAVHELWSDHEDDEQQGQISSEPPFSSSIPVNKSGHKNDGSDEASSDSDTEEIESGNIVKSAKQIREV